jgi:hypothetical protein
MVTSISSQGSGIPSDFFIPFGAGPIRFSQPVITAMFMPEEILRQISDFAVPPESLSAEESNRGEEITCLDTFSLRRSF